MTDTTATEESEALQEEEAPRDELREGLLASFTESLGERVLGSHIAVGRELWIRVAREDWVETAEIAKTKLGCMFLDFVSALDWQPSPWGRYETAELVNGTGSDPDAEESGETPALEQGYAGGETRFQMICRLVNVRKHYSVIVKADLPDDDLSIASLVHLHAGANWHERECWEMFGVTFDGHPGLRHLYLPVGFEGHPLRKDFPLLARVVKPWPGVVDVELMPLGDDNAEPSAEDKGEGESNGEGGDE